MRSAVIASREGENHAKGRTYEFELEIRGRTRHRLGIHRVCRGGIGGYTGDREVRVDESRASHELGRAEDRGIHAFG